MKNIISQTKFKKLYENKQIKNTILFKDKLNESMDVSNGTGFSDSLVGRAMNKIFSFVATRVEYAILGAQKKKYDEILSKAVTAAAALMNKTEELDKEQETPSTENIISNVIEYSQVHEIEEGSSITMQVTQMFKLKEQQIELYKELETLQKEIIEEKNKEYVKEETFQTQTQADTIIEFIKTDDKSQNIKKQQESINSILAKIKQENITDENQKMINVISTKLSKEIENISDEQTKSELSKYKENLSNMSNANDSLSEEEYKKRVDEFKEKSKNYYKKELEEEFKKISNLLSAKKIDKATYKSLVVLAHPDKNENATDEEMKNNIAKIKEILKAKNITLETRNIIYNYLDMLFEDHIFEADIVPLKNTDVATTNTDVATTNTDVATTNVSTTDEKNEKIKELKEKISAFSKELSAEQQQSFTQNVYKKEKIKSAYTIYFNDSKETKEAIEKLGDKDINNIDSFFDNLSVEEKKKFIDFVKKSVNIEQIKVVGFKIEPLYNTENHKDDRKELYDRVNFSTTTPDKKKIYNKWQIMISEVKSDYTKYFSLDGRFPDDYDPIKLINSDIKSRDKENSSWEEYEERCDRAGVDVVGRDDGNQPTTTNEDLDKLDLKQKQGTSMLYIFELTTTEKMAILFKKIDISSDLSGYYLKGMYNYDKILKEVIDIDINSSDEIIKIVEKNQYQFKDNDEKGKKVYNIFRPFLDLTDNKEIAKIRTIFVRKNENIIKGDKIFIQTSLYNKNIKISKFEKNKDKTYKQTIVDIDTTTENITFSLKLIESYSIIQDSPVWEHLQDKSDYDVINEIMKIYKNNNDKLSNLLKNKK